MGILRRRKRPAQAVSPDAHLTFLASDQAERLRGLVRQAFAERGVEVTVYADHVRDDSGRQFGLWNIAAICRGDPDGERAWPEIVREHIRIILDATETDPFDGVPLSDIMSRTYLRLYPEDVLPDWSRHGYARRPAPGLVELLALDMPETVATFQDRHVEKFGGADDLRRAGLANLRALPVEERRRMTTPDGGHFEVLLGESFFTASRVLVMPEVISAVFGPVDLRYGVLTCMATRHQLGLHVIRDGSVIPSLQQMAGFASAGFADSAGGLSPNVYWWRDGALQQLSEAGTGPQITVHVDAEFGEVLEAVTGLA